MKCLVCGKEIGFWSKLGHSASNVCNECRQQAKNRLDVLARSAGTKGLFKQQYAQGWLNQYDEIVRKYQFLGTEAAPFRNTLLENIFKLVESEDELADADLTFVAGLAKKYDLAQSATPEMLDTLRQIGTRQVIQSWEHGTVPKLQCASLVLQKDEVCHWEESAGLLIQRTKREYVGGSTGVSVPVGHGVRVRVGAFRAVPIDKTIYESGGSGTLHITNQRICWTGQEQSIAIPYKKVISLAGFDEGFEVHTSNPKKPGIFLVPHPELTVQLVSLAAAPNESEPTASSRRKKLPVPTEA
jgi:hypothetical protein